MLKVCSSFSKKIPGAEPYSSRQYHCSIELELSDALSPAQLQEKLHSTFAVVKDTVESEINGNANGNGESKAPASRATGDHKNGGDKATNAQIKYLTSLSSEQDIRLSSLNTYAKDHYGVDSIYELTKKQASEVVDALKHHKLKITV